MQTCGERSIFGEELGKPGAMPGAGGDTNNGLKPAVIPPPANKGGADAKRVDVTLGPTRRYGIRMLSASEGKNSQKCALE